MQVELPRTPQALRGATGGSVPLLWGIEIDYDGTIYLHSLLGGIYTMDRSTLGTILIGATSQLRWALHFRIPADGQSSSIGSSYSGPAATYSTGMSGATSANGSDVAANNEVKLVAASHPQSSFGFSLNSKSQGSSQLMGSRRTLCVGGNVGRYDGAIFNTVSAGEGTLALDSTPTGAVAISAGETWNFTCWYRDANPAATSNFTDAVAVLIR